ncbi:sigma 54-interacting transcriptional regulator [Deferribacteraceae bacterium V6Fe1]|nr:sigma 54-interacting transcriptional regulator [Deferribacteraceae bacterium V6Fe1]
MLIKTFYKKMLDNLPLGIITTDPNGNILYLNKYYADFLSVNINKALGKNIRDFVPNTRMIEVAKSKTPEINFIHDFVPQGVSTIVHRIPIIEDNEVIAVFGIILITSNESNDITEKLTLLNTKIKHYETELKDLKSKRFTFDKIIGITQEIIKVKEDAKKASKTNLPVLIVGESGTGKEMIAQAIHYSSSRSNGPFVRINCSAIPKELFESELFGYEKGSFTGADSKGKIGKFEIANNGTIFLDEIGDMPLSLQPKLLRVLEYKEFERVGGNKVIKSDFRIIAATNKPLEDMVKKGEFRADLFFRLNVINIKIPPLRERKEDVPILIQHFIDKTLFENKIYGRDIKITENALKCLVNYSWPGNARELQNIVDRLIAITENDIIDVEDLPAYIQIGKGKKHNISSLSLKTYLEEAEKDFIRNILKKHNNNKNLTAKKLGIHRTLLYKKMKKLGLS